MTRFKTKPQMAYITALLLAVLMIFVACLAGCTNEVDHAKVRVAENSCKNHEGWEKLYDETNVNAHMHITCVDGALIDVQVELK
jgi:major membrane immunogen (membrane-anchored lipoprotein)